MKIILMILLYFLPVSGTPATITNVEMMTANTMVISGMRPDTCWNVYSEESFGGLVINIETYELSPELCTNQNQSMPYQMTHEVDVQPEWVIINNQIWRVQ